MRTEVRNNVHGGDGAVTFVHLLEKEDMAGKASFAARISVPVGESIGTHLHENDAAIFIIVSGTAMFDDNGTLNTLTAGDACFTNAGESHGIRNAGDTALEIIGIVIFQRFSQPVAPSIADASYREGEMVCNPASNINICTPDFHMIW